MNTPAIPVAEPAEKSKHAHQFVETGIYRCVSDGASNGTYHERPRIGGRRTWRNPGAGFTRHKNRKLAREA